MTGADHTQTPCGELPVDLPPETWIARNFRAWELSTSELATRRGIDNRPPVAALRSAVRLAREILQPVRDHFGIPYTPNSVFRGQPLERALKGKPAGWISRSQHTSGEAADLELPGVSNGYLAQWIATNLHFDQLILELYDSEVMGSGWVHVSLANNNRGQVLRYARTSDGGYAYTPGLGQGTAWLERLAPTTPAVVK